MQGLALRLIVGARLDPGSYFSILIPIFAFLTLTRSHPTLKAPSENMLSLYAYSGLGGPSRCINTWSLPHLTATPNLRPKSFSELDILYHCRYYGLGRPHRHSTATARCRAGPQTSLINKAFKMLEFEIEASLAPRNSKPLATS